MQVEITNISGSEPYDIFVCDINALNCVWIDNINDSDLPYLFDLPEIFASYENNFVIKFIDSNLCSFTTQSVLVTPTPTPTNTNPEKEKYMADVLDRKIYTRSLRQGLEDLGEQITVKQYLDIYAGSVKGQIDQLTRPDRYDPSRDIQKDFDYYLDGTMNNIAKKLGFMDIPTEPVLDYFKSKISPLQKYLIDKINQLADIKK